MKFWGFQEKGIENFESSVPNRGVKQVFFFDPDGKAFFPLSIYVFIV